VLILASTASFSGAFYFHLRRHESIDLLFAEGLAERFGPTASAFARCARLDGLEFHEVARQASLVAAMKNRENSGEKSRGSGLQALAAARVCNFRMGNYLVRIHSGWCLVGSSRGSPPKCSGRRRQAGLMLGSTRLTLADRTKTSNLHNHDSHRAKCRRLGTFFRASGIEESAGNLRARTPYQER